MDGQLHREHISSELSSFFSQGHAEGTITSGHFEYDEATLRGLVTEWKDLADHYTQSIDRAAYMAQVQGPGRDFASGAQAEAANVSGHRYIDYLRKNEAFSRHQAQLHLDALNDYLGIEHRNVTEINKSGPQAGV